MRSSVLPNHNTSISQRVRCRLALSAATLFLVYATVAHPQSLQLSSGSLRVEVAPSPFSLRVTDLSGGELVRTAPGAALRVTRVTGQNQPSDWGTAAPWQALSTVLRSRASSDSIEVDLATGAGQAAIARLTARVSAKTVRFECAALDTSMNRVELRLSITSSDRFYGLGERFGGAEHHGKKYQCWCVEGDYFHVPYFYSLPRSYAFLIDDTHLSEFDFGQSASSELRITNWNSSMRFLLFGGASPLETMETYTAFAGRATMIPKPWVFAPWVSANGSIKGSSSSATERTYYVADLVRSNNIPCGAIWNDDWDFNYAFNYAGVVSQLHQRGYKALGYRWPYLYGFMAGDAKSKGVLTMCGAEPCGTVPLCVQPDLTTTESRQWAQDNLLKPFYQTGGDGWMHDFGEYTPANSLSGDGRRGWAVHNEYPLLWARTGREFWDKMRPDGDWVFFMRSGYTGSWKYAPVMWTGDQSTDWGGIEKVIPGVIGAGVSGFPIVTTDIGGYLCILNAPADRELYYRWTQLGALLPVMREHNGYYGCGGNFRFDTDSTSVRHWKKYAELHTRLFPYIYTLVHEAKARGWPVVRHMMLHYPREQIPADRQNDQFMLGDRVLVAPVLRKGATTRQVYLPAGTWVHFWTGATFAGGKEHTVQTPLEQIPIFVRAGRVLPLYDQPVIHTLVEETQSGLMGFTDANKSMKVQLYGASVSDTLRLWDNTAIECVSGTCVARGGPSRVYTYETVAAGAPVKRSTDARQTAALGMPCGSVYDILGRALPRRQTRHFGQGVYLHAPPEARGRSAPHLLVR